jgi:methylenetetrahydrofolate reductase (NADPH)
MRLTELLNKDEVTISCELFPPKQGAQLENYKNIVKDMAALKPAYMSVTYGATGGTSDYTVKLAEEVRNNNIPALAHLTCASSTREKVASVIEELKAANIENILALRGDIPANADFPLPDQYKHASELIADIKAQGDFCIGGACYPEGHPEAATIFEDLDHLKEKVDAGCEFLTTQMFFDNNILYNFMYKALKKRNRCSNCSRYYACHQRKPDQTHHIFVRQYGSTEISCDRRQVWRQPGSNASGGNCICNRADH